MLLWFPLLLALPQGSRSLASVPRRVDLPPERSLALASAVSYGFTLRDDRLLAIVDEAAQGQGSLNGDADATDAVLFWIDLPSDTRRPIGAVYAGAAFAGPLGIASVRESQQGATDLNGDGDATDGVLHSFDGTSTTNLGMAGRVFSARGRYAMVTGDESEQGVDLNGDGDTLDRIVHLFDGDTGALHSLGVSTSWGIVLGSELAIVLVQESTQGPTDLNGDGDTLDTVPLVVELATHTGSFLPLALDGTTPTCEGPLVGFAVSEAGQGLDGNGDGDLADVCAVYYDHATRSTHATGVAVAPIGMDMVHNVRVGSGFGAFRSDTGRLTLFDPVTAATTDAGIFGQDPEVRGRWVATLVSENATGSDLNGDGDQSDQVVHLLEGPSFVPRNLGLGATVVGRLGADWFSFPVSEIQQGLGDLNGDGDFGDDVAWGVDLVSGRMRNLGVVGTPFYRSGDLAGILVSEHRQNADLNGDGDLSDTHVLLAQPATGWRHWLLDARNLQVGARWAAFLRRESDEGADRNGDGDLADSVVTVQLLGR